MFNKNCFLKTRIKYMRNSNPQKPPLKRPSQDHASIKKGRFQTQPNHWTHRLHFSLHTFDAFQYRNYRFLWACALWIGGGYWLQQIVVGWLIYDITNSAFLTSVAMGMEAIPILIAGPIGGFLVDVFDRRRLLITICIYHGLLAFALAMGLLFWSIGPLEIFTFTLLVGFSWVISEPARSAVVANTVPKEGLLNAFALITLGWGGSRLAVPAIGGLLISIYGAHAALISESSLMLAAALSVAMIHMDETEREKPQLRKVVSGLLEAALYIRDNRVVLALLTFSIAPPLVIFPFVYGLLPVYAAEVFHVGATGLGILMSASGIGMVVGTIVVASLGNIRSKGKLIVSGMAIAIFLMAILSQVSSFSVGFGILVLLGLFMPIVYTTVQAAIQSIIPDYLRGRISGFSIVTWGAFPMGSLVAGWLAQTLSVQTSTLYGALLMGIILTAQLVVFRFIWKLE